MILNKKLSMKSIKIATVILLVIAVAGIAWYVFRPAPTSVANLKVDESVQDIPQFIAEFEVDETAANEKYLDKIIEVQGVVSDFYKDQHTLNIYGDGISGVTCNFQDDYEIPEVKVGQTIKVKGRCAGYLLDLQLMECCIEENGQY